MAETANETDAMNTANDPREECPECGKMFEPDPTGRGDRTELNLGKPSGFCNVGCYLAAEEKGEA